MWTSVSFCRQAPEPLPRPLVVRLRRRSAAQIVVAEVQAHPRRREDTDAPHSGARGLHSSASQLNLSRF